LRCRHHVYIITYTCATASRLGFRARIIAGLSGFLILSQSRDGPDLSGALSRFETSPPARRLVFVHAYRLGLEGIVSKRLSAPYRSGLSTTMALPVGAFELRSVPLAGTFPLNRVTLEEQGLAHQSELKALPVDKA
jgi:hypothetical protein